MLPLYKCWFAVVVGLLASCQLVAEDKPDSKEAPLEKAAKAFVALLGKGEFEKATGDFDEAMLKALPADKLKGTWAKVVADAGAFKKQLHSRVARRDTSATPSRTVSPFGIIPSQSVEAGQG
jgi:hypothetical protein